MELKLQWFQLALGVFEQPTKRGMLLIKWATGNGNAFHASRKVLFGHACDFEGIGMESTLTLGDCLGGGGTFVLCAWILLRTFFPGQSPFNYSGPPKQYG